jgi:hypothetical protein
VVILFGHSFGINYSHHVVLIVNNTLMNNTYICNRLFRTVRVHRLLNDDVLQSSYVGIRLFRLLISLFMIAHWIGSIFVGISQFQDVVYLLLESL